MNAPPRTKRGLPDYPRFICRTERVDYGRSGKWKAEWECKCGVRFESFVDNVSRRHTKSCGCDQVIARSASYPTHGHFIGDKPTRTYKSWQAMIARCTNPKHPAFLQYGGRGIIICEQWRNSFEQFLADVGERPDGKTLDRIETNGNYEPGNVQWATRTDQNRNKRNSTTVLVGNESVSLAKLYRASGSIIPFRAAASRVRLGWNYERAFTQPMIPSGRRRSSAAPQQSRGA